MLKSLHVQNFALIDHIEVEFGPGLNIITGETGTGKSILIDALGSTLGEKVDDEVLRNKDDKAIVEGTFLLDSLEQVRGKLKESELDDTDDYLILRKEVLQTGRNRAFINDTPVSVNLLTDVGDLLVDLHGQHEHQALLKVKYHIHYLDEYGTLGNLVSQVSNSYHRVNNLVRELDELQKKEKTLKEKKEVIQFQINEIMTLDPHPGEEEDLIQEEKILRNSEKLFELTNDIYMRLYETEGSTIEMLSDAYEKLDNLSTIDENFEPYKNDIQSAKIIIEELSKFLQSYNSNITFDPDRLQTIRERLSLFARLKKKYANTIEGILNYKKEIESELILIENLDEKIAEKKNEITKEKTLLSELTLTLSSGRKRVARELETAIVQTLMELGMPMAQFNIVISQTEDEEGFVNIDNKSYKTGQYGIDFVEFFISANPGEEPKPLIKVASGGEVSRIMLAIKTAMAEADKIPVLIFDEIDIGISGRIGQAVGKCLRKLSQTHQIICITHLPQIASMADHHFVVEKFSRENKTFTTIRKLKIEEKAYELAKLLGGETISDAHIKSAQELMIQANEV